jgi:tripartite-type tricarboxylate transporter receptor subunit TctC
MGFGNGLPQFRAIVVKAGTDPQRVAALAATLDRIGASAEYKAFLRDQLATEGSYIPAKNAPAFLEQQLKEMKRLVDTLPLHGQYLWLGTTVEEYVQPF